MVANNLMLRTVDNYYHYEFNFLLPETIFLRAVHHNELQHKHLLKKNVIINTGYYHVLISFYILMTVLVPRQVNIMLPL